MAGTFAFRWALLALVALAAEPLRALEVRETIWGFDGRVVPDCFNPLSVLVSNPDNTRFDGPLTLSLTSRRANQMEFVEAISLAPHASQWVQFVVYNPHWMDGGELRWGRSGKERKDLGDAPASGPPACVWLRDTGFTFADVGSPKRFRERLFPVTASAAQGLDTVILDHTPAWEPGQRIAFLDWVRLGGTVHLLRDANGQWPRFGTGLEALDPPREVTPIGLGRVVHHEIAPSEMSEKYLAAHGYPPRTLDDAQSTQTLYNYDFMIFRTLAAMTKPKVPWTLVLLLMAGYLAAIGPAHSYFRRRLDYRLSILVFLGCVAAFSVALGITGRRGYGEGQVIHSVSLAHALGGGRAEVTQWISAFATRSDRYALTHRAAVNLYSTDWNGNANGSRAFNGVDGHIELDIPLYSSQSFIHSAIMTGDDTSVTVEKWDSGDDDLRALRLKIGAGFPAHPAEIHAIYHAHFYDLAQRDGALELSGQRAQTMQEAFTRDKLRSLNQGYGKALGPEEFRALGTLLMARAARVPDAAQDNVSAPSRSADLQLLVLAPTPPSFLVQGKGFPHENGWVLYVQDVFKP